MLKFVFYFSFVAILIEHYINYEASVCAEQILCLSRVTIWPIKLFKHPVASTAICLETVVLLMLIHCLLLLLMFVGFCVWPLLCYGVLSVLYRVYSCIFLINSTPVGQVSDSLTT